MSAIEAKDISKHFGDLKAVDDVSFSITEGEIFGLLGPNGAGKTTLISMLVTMKKPTSGTASIGGFDILGDPSSVRKSVGIVFQDPSLDEELTAFENLELHAAMYGVGGKDFNARANEVLEIVGLADRAISLVKTFSGGMRRRLEIARGLLHYPKVLFLDEPTLGLDPQTRNAIWDYVRKLRKEHGMTILLTTHYMEEADSLCDRVAIIDHGKIIAIGTPNSLKDSLKGDSITVTTSDPDGLKTAVKKQKLSDCSSVHDGKVTFCVKDPDKKLAFIVAAAERSKISIESIELHKPTLDDVFLHYTGKTIREENGSALDSMRTKMKAWRGR